MWIDSDESSGPTPDDEHTRVGWQPLGAPVARLRDALYDTIAVPGPVAALIAGGPFLRLQGVKQLGFVQQVWPSATHTRYEHSLGVYHLAERALAGLWSRRNYGDRNPQWTRALLAAALLHDVGHYPFSHAIEELGSPVLPHERVGRMLIEASPLADVLERDWGVNPRLVADLVDPKGTKTETTLTPTLSQREREGGASRCGAGRESGASRSVEESEAGRSARMKEHDGAALGGLLSGALDVDKLDYLPRDARACNVPYGRVDVSRLLESLLVHPDPRGVPRLMIDHKGVGAVHSLISARQEMFDNVYWHHTNRACMAMLLRAVQDALEVGAVSVDELPRHDDASLLARLVEPTMPRTTRELATGLRTRTLHKRALELSTRAGAVFAWLDSLFFDRDARKRAEEAVGSALGAACGLEIAAHEVLLDVPKPEKWETEVWVFHARPPIGMRAVMTWSEATGTRAEHLARYEQHQRRVRVVTTERLREAAWARRLDVVLPTLERLAGD